MNRLTLWGMVLAVGSSAIAIAPARAGGNLDISPSVQNAVSVQNAQQIQLGFGVDNQEAILIQEQSQAQTRAGRGRQPSTPQSPRHRRDIPIDRDIRVAPSVQNATNVQNAQQLQFALPGLP
ncbi:hypothetical protein [Synechococcus sp. PCC 7336]|uniref:hypothetical protein n=1 Tax=Synechococcus sp. PCC 7336 TaxID=195250 RepID=UPI00034B9C43|nr:hypothetical protein [Synechococcus sp. PCC 7336]